MRNREELIKMITTLVDKTKLVCELVNRLVPEDNEFKKVVTLRA